jgi:hypothetical protein
MDIELGDQSLSIQFQTKCRPNVRNIRICQPKKLREWEEYYYRNVKPKEHLVELGRKLYIKITEVLPAEIEEITEQDCINYIINLVINRTFDGYLTEIKTIYGQLEELVSTKVAPAPDEWDRLYNVDFYITVNDKYIGLQIKPAGSVSHIPQIFKEYGIQAATHKKFTDKYGGKVFYVISVKEGKTKRIQNMDVIDQILQEMARLENL